MPTSSTVNSILGPSAGTPIACQSRRLDGCRKIMRTTTFGVVSATLLAFAAPAFGQDLRCHADEVVGVGRTAASTIAVRTGKVFYSESLPVLGSLWDSQVETVVASKFKIYLTERYRDLSQRTRFEISRGEKTVAVDCRRSEHPSEYLVHKRDATNAQRRAAVDETRAFLRVPYDVKVETGWVPDLEEPEGHVENAAPVFCISYDEDRGVAYYSSVFHVTFGLSISDESRAESAFAAHVRSTGARPSYSRGSDARCEEWDAITVQRELVEAMADDRSDGWRVVTLPWSWHW